MCGVVLVTACSSDPGADVAVPATQAVVVVSPSTRDDASISTSTPTSAPTPTVDPVRPEGFDRVRARVTKADGTICELCVWSAATDDQRRRGLMSVTDLAPADAMAFLYPSPHTGNFWMKNTVLPLSIAFYSPIGAFLDSFDMEPCTADPCPTYPTPPQFLVAVEVPQGELAALGMVAGSSLELLDLPCDEA